MQTVKLMIEIDKDDYDFMMECCPDLTDLMKIYEQIKNGTIITECETEDCISREFLIRDLYCKLQGETNINIHWIEGYLKKLPSVYPKNEP